MLLIGVGAPRLASVGAAVLSSGLVAGAAVASEAGEAPRGDQEIATDLVPPRPNQGHFWSVGLLFPAWAAGFDAARADRSWTPGLGLSLRVGESVTEWLDLGLAFAVTQSLGPAEERLAQGRLCLHSQWYLHPQGFVRLEVGAGSVAGRDPLDLTVERGGYSEAYSAAVGWHYYLSPGDQSGGWALSPVLGVDVNPADGLTAVVGWFAVEISRWTGLTKDKLRLPSHRAFE